MLKLFEAARRVSVPITVVRTADQFATMATLVAVQEKYALVKYDAANGLTACARVNFDRPSILKPMTPAVSF